MSHSILFGAVIVVVMGLTFPTRAADHTKDTTEVIMKAIADDKAVLLDVREKSEWEDGHIKDAKFLPWSRLKAGAKAEDVAKIIPKDKIVYCHCGSGVRCLKAADEWVSANTSRTQNWAKADKCQYIPNRADQSWKPRLGSR